MGMPTDPVSILLRQYARNGHGFDELARHVQPEIQRFIRRDRWLANCAEDISQETLATVFRKIHHYDQNRPALPWIIGLAKMEALRTKSKAGRIAMMERSFSSNGHEGRGIIDALPAPDRPNEMPPDMWNAMKELPKEQRDALIFRYVESLSFPEVGARMKRTAGSVASLAARGAKTLRSKYKITIPGVLVKRANEHSFKRATAKRLEKKTAKITAAASTRLDTLGVIERFNRIFPRLGELDKKLAAMEALLG